MRLHGFACLHARRLRCGVLTLVGLCVRHWPGLRISVENQAKSLHAVAYVKPVLFNRYTYFGGAPHASAADVDSDSDDGEADNKFRINLSSWLDCLNVFGRFCSLPCCLC